MKVFWPIQVAPQTSTLFEEPQEVKPDADDRDPDAVHESASSSPSPRHSLPPFTCVTVVCRCDPRIEALPHVASLISEFLDTTKTWSLLRACESARSIHLLRRLHAVEQRADKPTDRFYRDWLFNQCVDRAAAAGDLEAVKWLATEYSPGNLVTEGAGIAAANGHLDVLQWLAEEYGCALRSDEELGVALKNKHLAVVTWLLAKHVSNHRRLTVADWELISNHHIFSDTMYATESLEYLQWVAAECGAHRMGWGLRAAVNANRLPVVQWLARYLDRLHCEQEASGRASSSSSVRFPVYLTVNPVDGEGAMDCVKWVHEQQYRWLKMSASVPAMNELAAKGRLDDFKWLQANVGGSCSIYAMDGAAGGGHLEMVEWLHENATRAVGKTQVCMLRWNESEGNTSAAMIDAAANGHLQVLRWLHDNISEGWTTAAMDAAAKKGRVEVVRWLHENRSEGCMSEAMDMAAEHGHLDVVTFLHLNRSEGCSHRAMDAAAANNHLEVVIWLHINRTEGCTTAAMDRAASAGHLEVVKWLHEHRTEGCTTAAMDGAVRSNCLEMVQWLHANRNEGCTAAAMVGAVRSNRLEMVQWLHANRIEAISSNLIDISAVYGHLDLVRWLSLHCRSPANECTTDAMDEAAANGHLRVVKWLHKNRSEGCTTRAMDRAAGNGHFDVLLFLRANRSEGCSMTSFLCAFNTNRLEILRWLAYNYPLLYNPRRLLSRHQGYEKEYMKRWVTDGCLTLV